MKKVLIFLGVVILITIWYIESRSFFVLEMENVLQFGRHTPSVI